MVLIPLDLEYLHSATGDDPDINIPTWLVGDVRRL